MHCAGEVHFSSVERMQIRELFSIGHFFFSREASILASRKHESLWVSRELNTAAARQMMDQGS